MIILQDTERKAKKEHTCDYCLNRIHKEEVYKYVVGVTDSDFWTTSTHLSCTALANEMNMFDQMRYDEGIDSCGFKQSVDVHYKALKNEHNFPETSSNDEKLNIVKKHFKLI